MNNMPMYITRTLVIALWMALTLISSCANPEPPSGGPPDEDPPQVVSSIPENGTLRFNDDQVVIELNEYINRNKLEESIFISPEVETEISTGFSHVEIEFLEPLDSNVTYALTIGTEYTDLANNRPERAFTLIFSTGDRLDSGIIRGKVIDNDPAGAFIFLYPLADIDPDTLNPGHTPPGYRTQIGTEGDFEFQALPHGPYRLIAVRDTYRDKVFDRGVDAFGAPARAVEALDSAQPNIFLRIGPIEDLNAPQVYGVTAITERLIEVSFSESMNPTSIIPENFELHDSAGRANAPTAISAYPSGSSANAARIWLAAPLQTDIRWALTARNVRDSIGNVVSDTANRAVFSATARPDTAPPALLVAPVTDSSRNISIDRDFVFIFDRAIDPSAFAEAVTLRDSRDTLVQYALQWRSPNKPALVPLQPLEGQAWYAIRLSMKGVRGFNGVSMPDSLAELRFETVDIRSFGAIAGTLIDNLDGDKPYVLILEKANSDKRYTQTLNGKGAWEFTDIPPGSYTIWGYYDENENGEYDFGSPFPYLPAERFGAFGPSIKVRARWTFEDVKIIIQ